MTAPAAIPPGEYVPTADQLMVLYNVSWDDFETLLRVRGKRFPRMAYLDGQVELMSPSAGHEETKTFIGFLLETYCIDQGIEVLGAGSWLRTNKDLNAAAEPDECYIFGPKPRSKNAWDLVIEVVWTSGGIEKLEIYQRLGTDEVWFWEDGKITIYGLGETGYAVRQHSKWVPGLDLALVCKLVHCESLNEAVAQLRAATER